MTIFQHMSPDSPLRGYYAGFVSRAIAFILDLLTIVTIQFAYGVILRLIFNFLGLSSLSDILLEMAQRPSVVVEPVTVLITWTIAFMGSMFFFGLYAAVCWTLIDRTLGQALIGLRVLRTNGERLTFWRSAKRAVGYILAALPLFLGFLWILVDDKRQGWHDKLADTVVVYDWDARLGRKVREWLTQRHDTPVPPAEPQPPEESNT